MPPGYISPLFRVCLNGMFVFSNLSPALPSIKNCKEMFLSNHFFMAIMKIKAINNIFLCFFPILLALWFHLNVCLLSFSLCGTLWTIKCCV